MPLALLLAAALAQADVPLPPPPPGTTLVAAGEAALPPPPAPPPFEEEPPRPTPPRFGLSLEGGFPQGAALGLLYRPLDSLRLWAGPAWCYASFGVQGGFAWQPWRGWVSPILSVEAGRYFSSDVSFVARDGSGVPEELSPLMDDVGYQYGAALVGLELGSARGLSFAIKLGLAYVDVEARGTARATENTSAGASTIEFDDPRLSGTLPTVKLGLQYWF